MCTGYITATPISYNAREIKVDVQGKSSTVDLVDCCPCKSLKAGGTIESGIWKGVKGKGGGKCISPSKKGSNSWSKQTVDKIIAGLLYGYGVSVKCDREIGEKVTNHTVNPGEKIFDSINRLLTKKNLVITDDAYGNLVITSAHESGEVVAQISCGRKESDDGMLEDKALAGSAQFDVSSRYAKYVIIGQHKGSDTESGKCVSQDIGVAFDEEIHRNRLLVIKDSGQSNNEDCGLRALFESNIRKGKYAKTSHTVQGWRMASGKLWNINTLVQIKDDVLAIDGIYLISKVIFTLDSSGLLADMK